MSVNFDSSSENPVSKGLGAIRSEEKVTAGPTSGVETNAVYMPAVFPTPIDEEVNTVAMKHFEDIDQQEKHKTVSKLFIPEGDSRVKAQSSNPTSTKVDTFRILAKEGFYQKRIKAVSESTKQELELERQEKRLRKYRDQMEERFLDYLKNIQERRQGSA